MNLALLWPESRLSEAIEQCARTSGLSPTSAARGIGHPEFLAAHLGLEAQPVETPYPDFEQQLPKMGPALLQIPGGYLAICTARNRSKVTILSPDGRKHHLSTAEIRTALCGEMEAPVIEQIDATLNRAAIPPPKQAKARQAILRERFSTKLIRGIWLLRLPPSANFWQQLRQAKVPQRLLLLTTAHAVQYALWLLAWWIVGVNVLSGNGDRSWLLPWALLLLTLVPLRVAITWLQGLVAIGAGARLKQRLFFGALKLEPDSIRHQGAGQLLGRVIESEAVDALALSGGFLGVVALLEIAMSLFVLQAGAGGFLQAGLLLAWLLAGAIITKLYFQRNREWTSVRLRMTHDLVESMVGHRTRLAQLPPERWHDGEDQSLAAYLKSSQRMDRFTTTLLAIIPRGWLLLGLLGLAPAFAKGAATRASIAIAVGGMLLAYRALKRLSAGAWQLAGAAVAWERVAVLYESATRPSVLGSLTPQAAGSSPGVEARDITFRYSERTDAVLRDCRLNISSGGRVVLEGASGGGKSTLVSILVGLREPNSGSVLFEGFERREMGAEQWRKYIAAAPQFHENHVLAETFAFNLFMGRSSTLGPADFAEGEAVCQELGLGALLERMPAGMLQVVGETGWQLSHGERSRLYIARALLQNAEVVILDESFAALDPENLQRAVECVTKRAKSLLVIAHR